MTDKPSPISDEWVQRIRKLATAGNGAWSNEIVQRLLIRLDLAEAKASVTFPADHMLMPTTQYHRLVRHEEELKAAEAVLQTERDKVTRLRRALEEYRGLHRTAAWVGNKIPCEGDYRCQTCVATDKALEEA